MAKLVFSIPNGDGWRAYALRAARYGSELRALDLPGDHPERIRARRSVRRGINNARRESWKCRAALHIIRALAITKQKKALAAA